MRILLFDMDGVLVEPHAYHRALMDTVSFVGRALGYGDVAVTAADIAAFEAAGVSSEWASSAICAALLLENLWQVQPEVTLPDPPAVPLPEHGVAPPSFRRFCRFLARPDLKGMASLDRAQHLLLAGPDSRTAQQRQAILDILCKARQIEGSVTHRVFQELVLGSRVFVQAYGMPALLDTESYLLQYDVPTLSAPTRQRLIKWLQADDHRASIFTNRPSRPVGDQFDTPEAEMGAESVGLENLPIVGIGGLVWLSHRCGRDRDFFLKPSAVHALAAMRAALGGCLQAALEAAAGLVLNGQDDGRWHDLSGCEIYVFEDTVGGLESALGARDMLAQCGVAIKVCLFGVTGSEPKRHALQEIGAIVVPSLSAALQRLPRF